MSGTALSIRGLTKRFGGLTAVDHVDLDLVSGKLNAIIGPNGAGKTTLFNLISGIIRADEGAVLFEGKDVAQAKPHQIVAAGISRTLQIKSVFSGLSVEDNLRIAVFAHNKTFSFLRPARGFRSVTERVDELLEIVGLTRLRHRLAGTISYGDLALLELGIALANDPKLLLLDEPICGMSPNETEKTVAKIQDLAGRMNVVLIEHDMEVVFAIADDVTVMANGKVLARGKPKDIAANQEVQDVYLGAPEGDL
ncbi:lipopolysaccharide export system ATP-binding protein LptB [Variibacter gotjawalensis]|uniref:Lipopolysaccharide export system ATP-binding protein LptB n=1 Tax=Variibacter gotjawalensis TaxID=1333996 RepID=A0A0S3Q048_9BRAD|nr:ABC transporter ATP-binding protein [Variibacter gotjawalensis]NIK47378.1 branched-chain amino acid transport system ATP-binding protein [Variibacter gotjawalensis]RZS49274.1 amino acid/amide ABC transporter ATP-binding protein 1 (HAAT family) [Variibacter gotjawalensis]BAT61538.1 lipopolysaccharide export system ATP-binding protein LptB [Variibacter gotjawalensis]